MGIDMLTIPTQEARLALDMVAAQIMTGQDEGVALSNNGDYVRLQNLFTFHSITGPASAMILEAAKTEGKRQMMERQALHVRILSTMDENDSIGYLETFQQESTR